MFESALSLSQKQQWSPCLASGVTPLDELLGGGFQAGLSYLLYGSPHVTKFLLRCVANALRLVAPSHGVVLVDGDKDASPSAILDELKRLSSLPRPARLLNQLHVARAFTVDQLLTLLADASSILQQTHAPILFVTNVQHLLHQEEDSAASQSPRHWDRMQSSSPFRRAQLAARLKQLAFSQHIAVVASLDAENSVCFPSPQLGGVARHTFPVQIRLTQRGPVDIWTLEKHPSLPWKQCGTVVSE